MRWTTLRTIRTPHVTLRIEWTYDADYELDVQDEDGNLCEETRAKLDSGEWTAFGFQVTVHIGGVLLGQDSLWGSIYASPEEALAQRISGYLPDMVRSACSDARKAYRDMPRLRAA